MVTIRFAQQSVLTFILLVVLTQNVVAAICPGDCNRDGAVSIDELIRGVAMALSSLPSSDCSSIDTDFDGTVTISELVAAVNAAVSNACTDDGPTPTPSPDNGSFRIDGCVNEFPGESCGAVLEAVRLEPLGLTVFPGNDGLFHFENIPPGDYTLYVVSGCNPFGCWPSVHVSIVDHDVFVYMDLRPVGSATATPT